MANFSIENIVKFLGRKGYLFLFAVLALLLCAVFVVACALLALKTTPTIADFTQIFTVFKDGVEGLFWGAVGGNMTEHVSKIWRKDGNSDGDTPPGDSAPVDQASQKAQKD